MNYQKNLEELKKLDKNLQEPILEQVSFEAKHSDQIKSIAQAKHPNIDFENQSKNTNNIGGLFGFITFFYFTYQWLMTPEGIDFFNFSLNYIFWLFSWGVLFLIYRYLLLKIFDKKLFKLLENYDAIKREAYLIYKNNFEENKRNLREKKENILKENEKLKKAFFDGLLTQSKVPYQDFFIQTGIDISTLNSSFRSMYASEYKLENLQNQRHQPTSTNPMMTSSMIERQKEFQMMETKKLINSEKNVLTYLKNTLKSKTDPYNEFVSLIQQGIIKGIMNNGAKVEFPSFMLPAIQKATLEYTDNFLKGEGLTDYGVLDIIRSTHPGINSGTYFYQLTKQGDLNFIPAPYFIYFDNASSLHYAIFDAEIRDEALLRKATIRYDQIRDFQLFGTELMQSTVETIPTIILNKPSGKVSLLGTMFNEFLFGSSYATLNGMGKMMSSLHTQLETLKVNIRTVHEIKDTRSVQLLLTDQTDIELKGISIYFDFNRKMGRSKNKIESSSNQPTEIIKEDVIITNKFEEMLKLQRMFEEKMINKKEYVELKKEILAKYKSN